MKTGLILLGLMAIQPNRMSDVVKLLAADFLESFAAIGELLIDFDDFFRHLLVRILRSPHQSKVRSRSDPLVTIRIKANSQEHRSALSFLLLRRVRHDRKLRCNALKSSVQRRGQGTNVSQTALFIAASGIPGSIQIGTDNDRPFSAGPRFRMNGTATLAHCRAVG